MFRSISLGTASRARFHFRSTLITNTLSKPQLHSHSISLNPISNPQTWPPNNQSTPPIVPITHKKPPTNLLQSPWHNNRSKNPAAAAASRTPQNRSNTASPSPAAQSQQHNAPTTQASKPPPANVWAQRATQSRESSNGRSDGAAPPQQQQQQRQQSPATVSPATTTGFNAAEVKAFLARDAQDAEGATYKVQETAGGKGNGGGGGGGGAKGGNKSEYRAHAKTQENRVANRTFWCCRLSDGVEPAFLRSACEADCYFGRGRMSSRLLGAFKKMLHDHKLLVRGLVTAMRPRPVRKSAWGELGIGKKTDGP